MIDLHQVFASRYRLEKYCSDILIDHYCILPCHDINSREKWKPLSIVLLEVDRNQEQSVVKKYESKDYEFPILERGRIPNQYNHSILLWFVHDGRIEEAQGHIDTILV